VPLAAVLTAPRHLDIQDREPLEPGLHEVVLKTEYAGICGTDLALYSGDYAIPLPRICGHEYVGVVQKVGTSADSHWLGKRVTGEINNTCLAYHSTSPCAACKKNMPSHCLCRTVTGIINKDGAFSEEILVPAATLHEIPSNVDPLTAVLTEPLAAAMQTFVMTPVKEKETLVVLGPGRLGLLIVFVASLKGLNVVAVSRSAAKQKRALAWGAQLACPPEEARKITMDCTGGLGADMVVDATGQPHGLEQAMELLRPRGTLSVKTTCGLPEKGLDITGLVVNEIRIQGSRCGPFPPALELLTKHQNRLRNLITRVMPLKEANQALIDAGKEGKIVLQTQ